MGSCPDWYPTVVAARWLGVPPWELEQHPVLWRDRALAAIEADNHARQVKAAMAATRR